MTSAAAPGPPPPSPRPNAADPAVLGARHLAVAWWAVLGFMALLLRAIVQLTPKALDAVDSALSGAQLAALIAWVVFMAYSEGYKGFQRQMSPRVAARALYLARHSQPVWVIFAPLVAMGLLHATRKRLIISWAVLVGVVALIIGVRFLDQPWRGIVDAGVVVGLTWGLITTLWCFALALRGRVLDVPLDMPDAAGVAEGR